MKGFARLRKWGLRAIISLNLSEMRRAYEMES